MSEINKISPVGLEPTKVQGGPKKPQPEEPKFQEFLKSAEVFSQEVEQLIKAAEEGTVNAKVNTVGKTIDSLGELVSHLNPDKPHGPTAKQALERYEKQDPKQKV